MHFLNSPGIELSIAACLWVILFTFVEYGGHIDPPTAHTCWRLYSILSRDIYSQRRAPSQNQRDILS